jgi:hypothetical protein
MVWLRHGEPPALRQPVRAEMAQDQSRSGQFCAKPHQWVCRFSLYSPTSMAFIDLLRPRTSPAICRFFFSDGKPSWKWAFSGLSMFVPKHEVKALPADCYQIDILWKSSFKAYMSFFRHCKPTFSLSL